MTPTLRMVIGNGESIDERIAARVLDQSGKTLAFFAEPDEPFDSERLRESIVMRVLDEDFGDAILAGVAFSDRLGGDALGFT